MKTFSMNKRRGIATSENPSEGSQSPNVPSRALYQNEYQIHHKDFSKQNHSLDNLIFVCWTCHKKLHKNHCIFTSKFRRCYGMTHAEIKQKTGLLSETITILHYQKRLTDTLEKMDLIPNEQSAARKTSAINRVLALGESDAADE